MLHRLLVIVVVALTLPILAACVDVTAAIDDPGPSTGMPFYADATGSHPSLEVPLLVHYIDVGREDAVLIEVRPGMAVLVYGAAHRPGRAVMDYLTARGIRQVNLLVLTHPQADGLGILDLVTDHVDVDLAVKAGHLPGLLEALHGGDPESREFNLALGAAFKLPRADEGLGSLNGSPIVARLDAGRATFLFTSGDGRPIGHSPAPGVSLRTDALKLGYHDNEGSAIPAYLSVISPAYAIVRLDHGSYPPEQVLQRLRQAGADVDGPVRGHVVVQVEGGDVRTVLPGGVDLSTGVAQVPGPDGLVWSISRHPGAGESWVVVAPPGQRLAAGPLLFSYPDPPTNPRFADIRRVATNPYTVQGGAGPLIPTSLRLPGVMEAAALVRDGSTIRLSVITRPPAGGEARFDEVASSFIVDVVNVRPGGWVYLDLSAGPSLGPMTVASGLVPAGVKSQTPTARLSLGLGHYGGHRVDTLNDRLVVEIQGSPLLGKVIVLDPGHGGIDMGAVGPRGTFEKNMTIDVALRLEQLLVDAGATVYLTRRGDENPSTTARVNFANSLKADLLLSIHFNGNVDRSVQGTETFFTNNHPLSRDLANIMHRAMIEQLRRPSRYVVNMPRFTLLRLADMPTALVEPAYISNPEEELLIRDPLFRARVAEALLDGLIQFFGR